MRYISCRIHAECRSKQLIEKLFHLGLCVSYKRVLEISTALGNQACDNFHESGIVWPRQIPKNEFVTFAVDNIDHNPSSSTSTGSFHGTAISIRAHPSSEEELNSDADSMMKLILPKRTLKLRGLLSSYTIVKELPETDRKFVKVPQVFSPLNRTSTYQNAIIVENEWYKIVDSTIQKQSITTEKIHWSSFHAHRTRDVTLNPCVTALLPLFHESAHTPSMISHALNIAARTTEFLNPGQSVVIACDEPLFAITKELQWTYPDSFGNIVPMMGGLHIEMTMLKCIGQWLEGSEWDAALYAANVATKGVAESFIHGTHVTKCRYAHQVSAAVLHILKRKAFLNEELPDTTESFNEWNNRKIETEPTFHYWDQVLQLQQCLLVFVRAIRERNFELYICALEEMIPWFFALGHFNYARWAVVHLIEMKNLKEKFPDVYSEFMKGTLVRIFCYNG